MLLICDTAVFLRYVRAYTFAMGLSPGNVTFKLHTIKLKTMKKHGGHFCHFYWKKNQNFKVVSALK